MSERRSCYQLCQMLEEKDPPFFPGRLTGENHIRGCVTKRLGMTNPCNNAECNYHLAARTALPEIKSLLLSSALVTNITAKHQTELSRRNLNKGQD